MEPLNKSADLSALQIDRRDGPGARRFLYPAVATICVALVGVFLFTRSRGGVAFRPPEVTTTRAALVTPTQASTILTASGYIVARSKAEISPKTVGRIAWINLEEGQRVKKGELVARLEAQELDAQKRSSLAQRDQTLAQLANARLDRARARELVDQKIGTQQAFDTADSQVKALEAQVSSYEAQARYYEEQIKNAEIYAPIDGVVTVKKAFLGETVAPQGFGGAGSAGATFAIIVDLSSLEMEADINEQNVGKLVLGQPAEVALDAYPDKPYKARLRQIVPTADRQKRARAEALVARLDDPSADAHAVAVDSTVGGGSLPGRDAAVVGRRPARLGCASRPPSTWRSRRSIGRIEDGRVLLDLRTVDPVRDEDLVRAIAAAIPDARPMTVVVGTAGHIDHGKTSLLRALTGIDADRLPEERRRGMTIDVGYAHLALADGTELDFVDVPGHDRLIGNMLVGAGEIDAALLVVAADDGPRAQTIEHLELLDALGIRDGVAVVTKTRSRRGGPDRGRRRRGRAAPRPDDAGRLAGPRRLVVPWRRGSTSSASALVELRDRVLADDRPASRRASGWRSIGCSRSRAAGSSSPARSEGGRLERGATLRLEPGGAIGSGPRGPGPRRAPVESIDGGGRVALNLAGVDGRRRSRGAMS